MRFYLELVYLKRIEIKFNYTKMIEIALGVCLGLC